MSAVLDELRRPSTVVSLITGAAGAGVILVTMGSNVDKAQAEAMKIRGETYGKLKEDEFKFDVFQQPFASSRDHYSVLGQYKATVAGSQFVIVHEVEYSCAFAAFPEPAPAQPYLVAPPPSPSVPSPSRGAGASSSPWRVTQWTPVGAPLAYPREDGTIVDSAKACDCLLYRRGKGTTGTADAGAPSTTGTADAGAPSTTGTADAGAPSTAGTALLCAMVERNGTGMYAPDEKLSSAIQMIVSEKPGHLACKLAVRYSAHDAEPDKDDCRRGAKEARVAEYLTSVPLARPGLRPASQKGD